MQVQTHLGELLVSGTPEQLLSQADAIIKYADSKHRYYADG